MLPATDAPASPSPPPAPRPVPSGASSWNQRFFMLFGGIWFTVGTILAVVFTLAGGPVWNDWTLDSRGVRADARPFEEHATNSRVNGRTVHEIQFHFNDAAGQEHTGHTGTTAPGLIAGARKGTAMAIEYDPQNPALVRLVGGSASFFGVLGLLPVLFSVVGGALFLRGLLGARQVRATYRNGTAVAARVVSVAATGSRQNYQRVMRVAYESTGPTATVKGTWKTLRPPAQGATIWVIYDPQHPERSIPADV